MRIEAFSAGKDRRNPHANEDRFVVLPGRAYAVIDGATDRLGTRYDGMLSGQYAAVTVQTALQQVLSGPHAPLSDGTAIIGALGEAIADAYRRHGILDLARTDPNHRFSATLALVTCEGDAVHLVLVGDSGVRLNGQAVHQVEKDLDLVTSMLRRVAWPRIAGASQDPLLREQMSRRVAFFGTGQDAGALLPGLSATDLASIEREAVQANAALLPHVPQSDIERLVRGGIVNAQGGYQNDPSTVLGYSCLDGFEVPASLVHSRSFSASEIQTVELYTDGYFRRGAGFGIESWEAAFRDAEREDPEKISLFFSPKGSTGETLADDRTYLGVDLRD
jgi:serine/threonine protein phosphatase PrpC